MKEKQPSRRQLILDIFHFSGKEVPGYTCIQICQILISKNYVAEKKGFYLSGSVSSILNRLVKDNVLVYDTELKGPKGGYVYKLKPEQ